MFAFIVVDSYHFICLLRVNLEGNSADITMKEAVEYLLSHDENYQHCGASFIQHSTYKEDKAKQEVRHHPLLTFPKVSHIFLSGHCTTDTYSLEMTYSIWDTANQKRPQGFKLHLLIDGLSSSPC